VVVADLVDPGEHRHEWLELDCSGRALDRAAQRIGANDGADLVERARAGDSRAMDALVPPTHALGAALAGAAALLDPDAIILTGGVARWARRASAVDPPIAR
jgi:glucokinase